MADSIQGAETGADESMVICHNGQGVELHGTLIKLSRFQVTFEIYSPPGVLRLSESLSQFKILIHGCIAYSGRAVITNLIHLGAVVVCEAGLGEEGVNLAVEFSVQDRASLRSGFERFLKDCGQTNRVLPEFKVVMADMQSFFLDLRLWLEQVELMVRSEPNGDRLQLERGLLESLHQPILPAVAPVLEHFETLANKVEPAWQPAHRAYMRRQIHPMVMCSPFLYRTFQKPLGYAGDYEMVNMMLRDPYEGASMFAKLINRIFLNTPPVVAHRNRIDYLVRHLNNETGAAAAKGKTLRVFNVGCGPAKEIQRFLADNEFSNRVDFTLLDFNEETVAYTSKILGEISSRHHRQTRIQMIKRSVHQMLRDSSKPVTAQKYEFVYCAGLFDYLSDPVCKRLVNLMYDMLVPGGLLIVTNVSTSNPSRNWMEYVLDWHLLYRGTRDLEVLVPESAPLSVQAIGDAVNMSLEIRKPANGS